MLDNYSRNLQVSNTDTDRQSGQNSEQMQELELSLMVSPNMLSAYLRVLKTPDNMILTKEIIDDFLSKKNIKYGIFHDEIEQYCSERQYYKELLVARGDEPEQGQDGQVRFLFKKTVDNKPTVLEDGSVDYKNLDIIQNVKKNEVLCEIIKPIQGKGGVNVYGDEIKPKEFALPEFPKHKNARISDDKLQLIADVDGAITYDEKSNTIAIEEVLTIKGNVDNSCGNINFCGSVIINGDVREGFEIHAGNDIVVKGTVEGAKLIAQGNITLYSGMVGMGKGILEANRDISCSYIENANIKCSGTLTCDVIINSSVEVDKDIILKGRVRALMGGNYLAGGKVVAKNIGTQSNVQTLITIRPPSFKKVNQQETETKSMATLINEINAAKKNIEMTDKKINKLGKITIDPDNIKQKIQLTKTLISQKTMLLSELDYLEKDYIKRKKLTDVSDCAVICNGTIYIGVKVTIGYAIRIIDNNIINQKIVNEKGEIVFKQILPHEVM